MLIVMESIRERTVCKSNSSNTCWCW